MKNDTTGFTSEKYFEAEIANMKFALEVFNKSHVLQYVNFIPCEWYNDYKYMSRLHPKKTFTKDEFVNFRT